MSFSITLNTRGKESADTVRATGKIPAVIYGAGGDPVSVSAPLVAFQKLFDTAGTATLIDVSIDAGAPVKALIQDVQYDAVRGVAIHADFRRIDMNKPMEAEVELRFVGESPAVKGLGGTFVAGLESIRITCLPKDLVSHIDVDISKIATFDDTIRVADLALGAGITIDQGTDTVVAKVLPPLTEEQIKAMEESQVGDLSKIEVEKKKGKEEAAEGAEAPEGAEKAEKADKGKEKA